MKMCGRVREYQKSCRCLRIRTSRLEIHRPAHWTGVTRAPSALCEESGYFRESQPWLASSESGGSSDSFLKFRPSQQISQAGLKKVGLGLIFVSSGLPPFGH
jgi:hypothetical protein